MEVESAVHGAHAFVRLLVVLILAIVAAWSTAGVARAEGSAQLYPTNASCVANSSGGSCRANIEWRTDAYGPATGAQVRRRSLFQVFAHAGEVLEMGSSAVGVNSGNVLIYNPGVITDLNAQPLPTVTSGVNGFSCQAQRTSTGNPAQGVIGSRAQELAGPQSADGTANLSGYVPCFYVAPADGIYGVVFYGPLGDGFASDGGPTGEINLTSASNFNATQGTTVAAWDLTVRSSMSSTTNIDGRLFTNALIAFTGGNARPINVSVDVVTLDGFRYRTFTRGLDPNGFAFYGNQVGFYNGDGTSPLYHDAYATTSSSALTALAGGVTFAPALYPIFLGAPATETLAALGIPNTATSPTISGLSFVGNVSPGTSSVGAGGTFTYTANESSVYQIVISRDGVNFDPGASQNRVLRGVGSSGPQTVTWDGKDNSGADFPIGSGYAVKASLHAGEYHFPLIDAENSTLGGPTFTLLNPPGGTCPLASCSTAFFDDRGYHTNGPGAADVGTPSPPDTPLCGAAAPAAPYHSDPVAGYDSTGSARAYGADAGGNTNVPCTGSFGDVKGLDTWTYFPSINTTATLNVVGSTDVSIVKSHSGSFTVGQNGTFNLAVANAGTLASGALTVTDVLPAGLAFVSGSGAGWSCGAAGGTVTCTNSAGLASGGSSAITLAVAVAAAAAPSVVNTASVASATFDANSSNNSSNDSVTVIPVPSAVADAASTPGGTAVLISVLANDDIGVAPTTITSHTAAVNGTVSCTSTQCTYTPAAGFAGTNSFTYTITDANARTSTATVTITVGAPPATIPPAPVSTPPAAPAVLPADLTTTVAGPKLASPGAVVTLTATIRNNGPAAATATRATLSLPLELVGEVGSIELRGAPAGSSCTLSGSAIICTLGTLPAGGVVNVTWRARVRLSATPGTVVVRANVGAVTIDSKPANNPSSTPLRIIGRATETAEPSPKLSLTTRVGKRTVRPGSTVRVVIRVRNTGAGEALETRVCLPAPVAAVFVSAPGATLTSGSACWLIPRIGPGGSQTLSVVLRVDATAKAGPLRAVAVLTPKDGRTLTSAASVRVLRARPRARPGGVTG